MGIRFVGTAACGIETYTARISRALRHIASHEQPVSLGGDPAATNFTVVDDAALGFIDIA
jgi:hypothetical protein